MSRLTHSTNGPRPTTTCRTATAVRYCVSNNSEGSPTNDSISPECVFRLFASTHDFSPDARAQEQQDGSQRYANRNLRSLFGLWEGIRVRLGIHAGWPAGARHHTRNRSAAQFPLNTPFSKSLKYRNAACRRRAPWARLGTEPRPRAGAKKHCGPRMHTDNCFTLIRVHPWPIWFFHGF